MIYKKLVVFIDSKVFFWLIVAFFVVNALWIAFSLRFPLIYDERYHFDVIQFFSHQWSPIVTYQSAAYDGLGALVHGNSLLYHYIMSFPYRIFAHFVDIQMWQVIFLRALNILMAATGLWLYARLFRAIKIKQKFINVALLIFVLLPIVPLLSAHINYDNMLFPLTAFYLLLCVYAIKSTKVNWAHIAGIVIVGCFASLVKFTFLPIFAVSIIYLAVLLWRRHGVGLFAKLWTSTKRASKPHLAIITTLLIISIGLFSLVYLQNMVRYGTYNPACQQVMSEKKCLVGDRGGITQRNLTAKATKNQRPVVPLSSFSVGWFSRITMFSFGGAITTHNKVVFTQAPPVLINTMVFGLLAGIGVLIYAWRSLRKNSCWYFLLSMAVTLTLAVFYINVTSYYSLHDAFANQPRYLLSIMPIVMVMAIVAINFVLRKTHWAKLALLVVVLLLFTQGGGAITTIIKSDDTWYWQRPKVIRANHATKKILNPFIKEGTLLN